MAAGEKKRLRARGDATTRENLKDREACEAREARAAFVLGLFSARVLSPHEAVRLLCEQSAERPRRAPAESSRRAPRCSLNAVALALDPHISLEEWRRCRGPFGKLAKSELLRRAALPATDPDHFDAWANGGGEEGEALRRRREMAILASVLKAYRATRVSR
jgi:hypothetical protein